MGNLVKKKVTVRSKKGKTYQRSTMVRAQEAKPKGRLARLGHAVNRALTGKTGAGTAFRLGIASGVAQNALNHAVYNHATKHYKSYREGAEVVKGVHQAGDFASHIATAAVLHKKGQLGKTGLQRLGQGLAHAGGRLAGYAGSEVARLGFHTVRRAVSR